jgi:hypothetical protein
VIDRDEWPDRELTAREQFRYLFGDPRVRSDMGLLGRFSDTMRDLDVKVDRLIRIGRWFTLTVVAALVKLVGNLIVSSPHH